MAQRLRIASIGLGDIAQKAYLPIVCCHELIEPIFCTRDESKLDSLKQKYRVEESYTDLELLLITQPDAVMIHSNTESHYRIAKQFLEAGIPVFVDKPLTYSLKESEELIELSNRNKTPLFLGFNRRYAPYISMLKQEPLSEISWVKNRKNLPGEPITFILDDFIHVIDSLLFLAPPPQNGFDLDFRLNDSLLEYVKISWEVNGIKVKGEMDRMHESTFETTYAEGEGTTWVVRELMSGVSTKDEKPTFNDHGNWASTLYKRGFEAMIDEFVGLV